MVAAQNGDRQAFATLVEMEGLRVLRFTSAVLPTLSDAQDAAQEAFISAWQDLPRLREPARWSAWVRRIAVRTAIEHGRRRRHAAEVELRASHDPTVVDPTDAAADRDEIQRALARLSADDRAILALRFAADLDMTEVAAAVDVPLGTAKSRLHRALARLRHQLEGRL